MKKIAALILTMLMLCLTNGGLAEEGRISPLYATVGEAMAACDENRVISGGMPEEYYAVVTGKDGKYFRNVAHWDEKLSQLQEELDSLDYEAEDFFEKHDAAMSAVEEHLKTLPIAYSEEFTAPPMTGEEMQAMIGKTLGQLTEEGFEIGSNGTEPGEGDESLIVYTLRNGVYDYFCTMDTDFDAYMEAKDNDTEDSLMVKSVALAGITEWAYDLRYHTDGTVEEQEDPFAKLGEIMTEIMSLAEKAQAGEEVDLEDFAAEMKEKYPDYAEMIDMYMNVLESYGVEGISSLLTPAE